jgi:hypothetical protein
VVRTQTDYDVAGFVWYEAVECNSCSSSSHNKFTILLYYLFNTILLLPSASPCLVSSGSIAFPRLSCTVFVSVAREASCLNAL